MMPANTYTYVGRGPDNSASHLDIHQPTQLEDPAYHARRMLLEHQSCDRVEIWSEDSCIMVVSRAASISAA
jgi:hypothetical protein